MASDFEELSKRAEAKAADLVKKGAAISGGTIRGVGSTMPRWLKVILAIAVVYLLLMVLFSLGEEPSYPY